MPSITPTAELSPANHALVQLDPLNELRLKYGRDYTPSPSDVAGIIQWNMSDLIQAEEYGHPTLSHEETLKRATDRLDLSLRALKQALIYEDKHRRGLWIACA